MHETTSILSNTTFWYCVAVASFVIFAFIKLRAPIIGWLDSEIAKVRAELDEAKRLNAEAAATLVEYKAKQEKAQEEAALIIQAAQKDAEQLRKKAEADLKIAMQRHEQLMMDRVRMVHDEAFEEVRRFVIDEVMIEARGKLKRVADGQEASNLLNCIIEDLPKLGSRKSA